MKLTKDNISYWNGFVTGAAVVNIIFAITIIILWSIT